MSGFRGQRSPIFLTLRLRYGFFGEQRNYRNGLKSLRFYSRPSAKLLAL